MNSALLETLSDSAADLSQRMQLRAAFQPILESLHKRAKTAGKNENPQSLIKGYLKLADDSSHFDLDDLARDALESALALKPESINIRTRLIMWLENNNRLEAAAELRRGFNDRPSGSSPRISIALAKLHGRKGEYQKAIDILKRTLGQGLPGEREGTCRFLLANNLHRLGKYREAFAAYRSANQCRISGEEAEVFRSCAQKKLKEIETLNSWYDAGNRFPEAKKPDDGLPAPIFLVGFPRSGTTLLDQILHSHPDLSTVSEQPVLQPLLKMFETEPERVANQLSEFTRGDIKAFRKAYWQRLRYFCRESPSRAQIVDKEPLNILHLGLIHFFFPDARIIVALRDPRDAILSNFMQDFDINQAMWHSFDLNQLEKFYNAAMTSYLQHHEAHVVDIFEVRYEGLVEDLEGVTRKLADFLGVARSSSMLDYSQTAKKRMIYTPSYHQVVQPIYRHAVNRWKNYEPYMEEHFSRLDSLIKSLGYT